MREREREDEEIVGEMSSRSPGSWSKKMARRRP